MITTFDSGNTSEFLDVNPDVIKWARISIGLSLKKASTRAQIPEGKIELLEKGDLRPNPSQLRRLAKAYKRSLSVFLLEAPPPPQPKVKDFRRLRDQDVDDAESLLMEFRNVLSQRESLLEVLSLQGVKVRTQLPSLRDTIDAETAAGKIAHLLGLDVSSRPKYRSKEEMLESLKYAFGKIGIMIRQAMGIDMTQMRGFAYYFPELPVIVINAKDSPAGRCFTLLHELVHLSLKQNSLCDLMDDAREEKDKALEIFCNKVAGLVLIPTPALKEWITQNSVRVRETGIKESAKAIAGYFKVSEETALRRLLALGLIEYEYYRSERERLQEEYRLLREKKKSRDVKGGISAEKRVMITYGKPYVETIFSAYFSDKISITEVISYLGIKYKHLASIENTLTRSQVTGRVANK